MVKVDKLCLDCGKSVLGRTDKKFCNDWCRNNFNNKLKTDQNPAIKNINKILRNNRKILEGFIPESACNAKASKNKLLEHGFNFMFYTHVYKSKKGSEYFFCYDYGYLNLENDAFFIVKK